jgi:exopolysaccharide biosynthesis protein
VPTKTRALATAVFASTLSLALAVGPATPGFADEQPASFIETDRQTRPVATGVTLDSFDRWSGDGWLRADALTVDLTSGATVDYLGADSVSDTEPISSQAGDRKQAVAAINGDFFDINDTGSANGVGVSDGELLKSANTDHTNAVSIDPDGLGHVLQVDFDGSLQLPDGEHELAALNNNDLGTDAIGEYTSLWGEADRSRVVDGAEQTAEVVVRDGVVTEVSDTPGKGAIPSGSFVLVGREAGAELLSGLAEGDAVEVSYSPRTSDDSQIRTAIGGNQLLVVDGEVQDVPDDGIAARSAVGFSEDGATMYLLTVDGKQADSAGVTVPQVADMMKDLGAHNAINIDGGGSSTLLAREPGQSRLPIVNSPSDGSERPVANGLAVSVPAGSQQPVGFAAHTTMDADEAPGDAAVSGGRPDRVFPGLSRRLTAYGFDETYAPAQGDPRWRSDDHDVGKVDSQGVFHARRSGTTTVSATRRDAEPGEITLSVLGELTRVDSSVERVGLADGDATGHFGVVGYDAAGYSAPIEPGDVTLDYDASQLSITGDDTGFTVAAKADSVATLVTLTVGDREAVLPVTVGLSTHEVAGFDDAADWKFSAARATGSLSAGEGHTGTGLQLDYDFTQSTATRAAYAAPPQAIAVPGQPQSFGMWINGQGNGEWPSLQLVDGNGAALVLRGDYVTWQGWQHVEMTVPPGTAYPLTVQRFYVAEVDPTASYQGGVVLDDLVANVPPDVDVPAEPTVADPVIHSSLDGRDWRFAVMSDAQFVAREPDSDIVASARRTLQEIKASDPEFVIINGDLVDEGSAQDLTFARQVLTEELGDEVPWHYVPGNHEVMGGEIDNFVSEFGDPYGSFDHNGTRFITLDTSGLNLRSGGFDQLAMLRERLDSAAEDDDINSVVVVEHVPPRDPMPQAASQLGDRKEADTVEQWLSQFGLDTGKGTGFVGGHVGTFAASHVDGVPYVINGNSGKNPASAPEDGGFVGWTEFGVNPVGDREQDDRRDNPYRAGPSDWLAAVTHAQVDELRLSGPKSLPVGDTATVSAEFDQQDRTVPLGYPVSADWSQSEGVYIGDASPRHGKYRAWFNPSTGELAGLRRGEATLVVTVNGVTEQIEVTVTG